MHRLTLYKNLDPTQEKVFRARGGETLNRRVRNWLEIVQPDVCAGFDGDTNDGYGGLEPLHVLGYCESEKDWEYRERISDVDCESGTLEEMVGVFIEAIQSFVRVS